MRVAVLDPHLATTGDEVVRLSEGGVDDAVVGGDGPSPVVGGAGGGLHLGVHGSAEAASVGSAGDGAAADGAVDGPCRARGAGASGGQVDGRLGGHKLELEWPAVGSHGGGAEKTLECISDDWICSYQSARRTEVNFIVVVVDLPFARRFGMLLKVQGRRRGLYMMGAWFQLYSPIDLSVSISQ